MTASSSYSNITFLDTRNSMALATWKAALTRSVTENCLSGSSEGVNHVGSYQPLLFLRNCSMFPYGQYSMITHKSQWRPMSQMRKQLEYWINNPTDPLILSPLVVAWIGEDLDTDRSDRTHRTPANFSTHTWYRSIHPNQLPYKSHTWETQPVAMSLTFLNNGVCSLHSRHACMQLTRINLGFWKTAHLLLPYANIITYFSLKGKCCLRGGAGGQFPRNLNWSVKTCKSPPIEAVMRTTTRPSL